MEIKCCNDFEVTQLKAWTYLYALKQKEGIYNLTGGIITAVSERNFEKLENWRRLKQPQWS